MFHIQMIRPDHAGDLPGGQHQIHIPSVAAVVDVWDLRFLLFGDAGHDRYVVHLIGIQTEFLRQVSLGHRPLHLMGRFGRGQLSDHLRILGFQKAHPAGTAGCEHGKGIVFPMTHPFQKFAALLHDGQICSEIRIKDIVKSQRLQRRHQTAGSRFLPIQSQFLRPGGAHRRSHLHDGHLVGIGKGSLHGEQLQRIVSLPQRSGGAVGQTLAADGAVGLGDLQVMGHAHSGPGACFYDIPDVQILYLITDLYAAHAFDTAAGVADQRKLYGPLPFWNVFFILGGIDAQVVGDPLQGAVSAPDAAGTGAVMLGQDQFHIGTPGFPHSGGIGQDLHPFLHYVVAGGHQTADAFDLHHADAAGADFIDIFQITQTGHGHFGSACRGQYGGTLFCLHRFSIDRDIYHFVSLPPFSTPKPK